MSESSIIGSLKFPGPYYCVCRMTKPVKHETLGWMCDLCKGTLPGWKPGQPWPPIIPSSEARR